MDVIVNLATEPEHEVSVGAAGKLRTFAHHIAPGLTEAMMRREARTAELDKAKSAAARGAVTVPSAKGTSVGGGWQKMT